MKWVADENFDDPLVVALRARGHEVWSVAEQAVGITDEDVLRHAQEQGAVLITGDKDFGELVFRQRRATHGVVLVRLPGPSLEARTARTLAAIEAVGATVIGSFTVVDATGVRCEARDRRRADIAARTRSTVLRRNKTRQPGVSAQSKPNA